MNKVLMITQSFPPAAGSGVLRTLKFVKYLPANGWLPVVLTLQERFSDKLDRSMLLQVPPEVVVERTHMMRPLAGYARVRKQLSSGKIASAPAVSAASAPEASASADWFRPFKNAARNFVSTPDQFVGWLPFALRRGLTVLRREKIELVYSTSPAPSCHLIAAALARYGKLPWVADFRDPWWALEVAPGQFGPLRTGVERFLERMVFTRATRIVANTEYLRVRYAEKYGAAVEKKIKVITNGYDEDDFRPEVVQTPKDRTMFTVSHVGEFYLDLRNPTLFLQAVGELLAEELLPRDRVRINFIGGGEYMDSEQFSAVKHRWNLMEIVRVWPHVSHQESLRYMFAADLLLLLQPSEKTRTQIPAKAFEYIRTGNAILTLAPTGATASLMQTVPGALVAAPDDVTAMKQAVLHCYRQWQNNTLCAESNRTQRFERRQLTGQLADIFNEIIRERRQ